MSSRVLAVLPVACLLLLAGLAPTASAQDLDHIDASRQHTFVDYADMPQRKLQAAGGELQSSQAAWEAAVVKDGASYRRLLTAPGPAGASLPSLKVAASTDNPAANAAVTSPKPTTTSNPSGSTTNSASNTNNANNNNNNWSNNNAGSNSGNSAGGGANTSGSNANTSGSSSGSNTGSSANTGGNTQGATTTGSTTNSGR